jgi:hypothetical protein
MVLAGTALKNLGLQQILVPVLAGVGLKIGRLGQAPVLMALK